MKSFAEKVERLLEAGGTKKDIVLLVISGIALLLSISNALSLPFDIAWVAIILCGIPILTEAVIGLITSFDIKADVLVSLALIASVIIGEDFAAGEVAFIMQIGGVLEELTVSKTRAGIEKLVHLTPQTARLITKSGAEEIIPAENVKKGDALERLAGISRITFDKTGTLTQGKLKVIAVKSIADDISDEDLYRYVASVENYSEHPLGKAIAGCYKAEKGHSAKALCRMEHFEMIPGQGVSAQLDMGTLLAGNEKMLALNQISLEAEQAETLTAYWNKGCTVILAALNHRYIGYVALADTIRKESLSMIKEIIKIGVTPVLVTGDNENAAKTIAAEIGIEHVCANCLPENKMNIIKQYQSAGNSVCMIGDGINDAPALKASDVGIAMGGIGSDIAMDAADIVLVDDEIKELPHLIVLSRRMMKTIKCNLSFSMGLNFLAIILAMPGILNPVVGALVHNCGSVLVILNSALLLKWKKKG